MTHFSPHTIKGGPSLASRPQLNGRYTPMPSLKLAVKLGVLVVFGVLCATASAAEESKRNLIGEAAELNANTYGTSHGNKCINGANCFPPTRSGCPSGSYLNKVDSKCYSCPKVPNCTGGETCTHGGDSKCPRDKCVKGCNHDGKGSCIKPPPTPNCPSGQYWDVKYKRCKSCNSVENCNKVTCTGPNDHRCDPRGCRDDCFHRDGKCHPKPPKQCAVDEYWDNKLRKCVKCEDIPNCKVVECRSERDKWCSLCEDGFKRDGFGNCICDCGTNPICPTCESFKCTARGTYYDTTSRTCKPCLVAPTSPAKHCNTDSIPPGTPPLGEIVCENCNGANPRCLGQCKSGYFNNDGKCEACPTILHCAVGKLVCTSTTTSACTECADGFKLDPNSATCVCPPGFYVNTATVPNQCVPCSGVDNCDKVTCDADGSDSECVCCDEGYYLENGICKSSNGGSPVMTCEDFCPEMNQYFNSQLVPPGCSNCVVANCPLANRVCKNCDGTGGKCIGECDAGYYNNNGDCTELNVLPVCNACTQTLDVSCGDAAANSPVQLCISQVADMVCVVGEVTNFKQLGQTISGINFDIGLPTDCSGIDLATFVNSVTVAAPHPLAEVGVEPSSAKEKVNKNGVHMWNYKWSQCGDKVLTTDEIAISEQPFVLNTFEKGWKNQQLAPPPDEGIENCIVPNGEKFEAQIVLGGEGFDDGCVQGFSFCLQSTGLTGCPINKGIFNNAVWYARMLRTEGDASYPANDSRMQKRLPVVACPTGGIP